MKIQAATTLSLSVYPVWCVRSSRTKRRLTITNDEGPTSTRHTAGKGHHQDTFFRASFANTEYFFDATYENESSIHINVNIRDFPEASALSSRGSCSCHREAPTRSFGEKNPCECKLTRAGNEVFLKGKISFNNPNATEAEAFVFHPRTGDKASIIPYLLAQRTVDRHIAWADKDRLRSPGVRKWADCNRRRKHSCGSKCNKDDHSVSISGCMVNIGDNLINEIEKTLTNECQPTVAAGIFARSTEATMISTEVTPSAVRVGEDSPKDVLELMDDEDISPCEKIHFQLPDAESLQKKDCTGIADILSAQRLKSDELFLNMHSFQSGATTDDAKDERMEFETCNVDAYTLVTRFECTGRVAGKVHIDQLRILTNAHAVGYQTTLPLAGVYQDKSTEYRVSWSATETDDEGNTDKFIGYTCKGDVTSPQWAYICTAGETSARVDFVYSAAGSLYLRYLASSTRHVAVSKYVDVNLLFAL
ncbi:hypothetical protein FOZ60_016633 [Perkinsus olseni]|uniref:Uncharacterized protein n=1 Tax=Perkinsus olseni TaxID=32597 RepID=A0A7J6PKG8_PEROL|nr:hypothetical protein FOZ60_016633 [Perkinsus olseni]